MNRLGKISYVSFIYGCLYLPIFVLILLSFNKAHYSSIWHGFTWHWYGALLKDQDLWIATWHSLVLGILSASMATVMGSYAAISLYRYRFAGRSLFHGLIFIFILLPDIIIAISLLLLFRISHLKLGFFSLLLAHTTFCLPFVVMTVHSRLKQFDKHIYEAAKDLGASDFKIISSIFLPLLWPGILAGWLMSFALSFDDVIISYFVSGPGFEILPLKIYGMARTGSTPEINALCAIVFVAILLVICVSQLSLRKKA